MSFAGRLPLRLISQPVPGLSNARNAAVAAATGEYMVWTDDDVLVESNWLRAYEAAFLAHPEYAFFGGPIRAHFDCPAPVWLQRGIPNFEAAFALRDLGDQPLELNEKELPFGANFAIRTAHQREIPYDPNLGRQPLAKLLGGEEVLVMTNLLRGGAKGLWVPAAIVDHRVGADRMTLSYIKDYYRGAGYANKLMAKACGPTLYYLRQCWLFLLLVRYGLPYAFARAFLGVDRWSWRMREAYILLGRVVGIRRAR
jgi:glycosyltransferase involved in cell wall biosynthesis